MLYTERAIGVKCEQSQMRTLYNVRELSVFSESQKRTSTLPHPITVPHSQSRERLIGGGKNVSFMKEF